MIFYDVQQGSDDWFEIRKGIPTASRFDQILTPKKLQPSASQDMLIAELIGERFSLIPPEGVENFTNRAIRWGVRCESEARAFYHLQTEERVSNGGFCLTDDERFGASPDSLVGADGALELKCPQANTHVGYLMAGVLPSDYLLQCHGHLIVTGRKWVDFLSYSPGFDPFLIRVHPNEVTDILRDALEGFWNKFMTAMAKVRRTQ